MKAVHRWKNLSIEKEVGDDTGFLLTNKAGGYCSFCFPNISRYNGFFVFDGDMFKVLESIKIAGAGSLRQLTNNFFSADADFGNCRASFYAPGGSSSLVVELDSERDIDLLFDVKKSYDNDDQGREYSVKLSSGKACVDYTKRKSGMVDYSLSVCVRALGSIEKQDEWVRKEYSLDSSRKSSPSVWYPYRCLRLKTKRFVITACHDSKKAERECLRIFSSSSSLMVKEKSVLEGFDFPSKVPLDVGFSYLSCINSLHGLRHKGSFFAGLPWFFQSWSRDSAVSVKALIDLGEYRLAKDVLLGLLSLLDYGGNLFCRQDGSGVSSADALGWICLRFSQLFSVLKKKGMLRRYITKKEEAFVAESVEHAVSLVLKFKTEDGLAVNGGQETWMDTDFEGDSRHGFRIEIQALRLAVFRFAFEITRKNEYKVMEDKLVSVVFRTFWNMSYLDDGRDDFTVRPNVFLAAYVYPSILKDDKWLQCFKYVVPELWLGWGGFSTIDKGHKLFVDRYTGEDNRSYHRGDSWFWVNNYAALVLSKHADFREYVDAVLKASCDEILWKGMLGCHAELSSAKELRSEGCWSQLWSNASFIELVRGLYL